MRPDITAFGSDGKQRRWQPFPSRDWGHRYAFECGSPSVALKRLRHRSVVVRPTQSGLDPDLEHDLRRLVALFEESPPIAIVGPRAPSFTPEEIERTAGDVLVEIKGRDTLRAGEFAEEHDLDLLLVVRAFDLLIRQGRIVAAA